MKDKLTKKRIRVDYQLIIRVLSLDLEFTEYLFAKHSTISERRSALAFLTSKIGRQKIEDVWNDCLAHGYSSFEDYQKEQIRVAQFNCWKED